MLSIEQIQKLLADRQLNKVADNVGLHWNTVYKLVKTGKSDYDTVKKISDYLEGQIENAKK